MAAKDSADPEDWGLANYIDMALDHGLITDETAARLSEELSQFDSPGAA